MQLKKLPKYHVIRKCQSQDLDKSSILPIWLLTTALQLPTVAPVSITELTIYISTFAVEGGFCRAEDGFY